MINLCRSCKKCVFYADSMSFFSQCGIKTVSDRTNFRCRLLSKHMDAFTGPKVKFLMPLTVKHHDRKNRYHIVRAREK